MINCENRKIISLIFILGLLFVYIISCDGSGGGSSNENVVADENVVAEFTVDDQGGTLSVQAGPLAGTQIIVPPDSIPEGEQVNITIEYKEELPINIQDYHLDAIGVSKSFILKSNSENRFIKPLTITIPFDKTLVGSEDVVSVFYFDDHYQKIMPVGVKKIDYSNGLVTFTTIHFTEYFGVTIPDLFQNLSSVDTGFTPENDGFFHPNFGTYDHPGGSCLGMANYSVWYYSEKHKNGIDQEGLYYKYRDGIYTDWKDDTIARELITRTHLASSQLWGTAWLLSNYVLKEKLTALQLIQVMKITKSPQTFLMMAATLDLNPLHGHAVTVYKYDGGILGGNFYIYDNNYPNESVILEWDAAMGFTNYSKSSLYSDPFTAYGFEATSSFWEPSEFESYYNGAENGWDSSYFYQIELTSPTENQVYDENLTEIIVSGSVSGGLPGAPPAERIVPFINGAYMFSGEIDENGNFSFTILKRFYEDYLQPINKLQLVATLNPNYPFIKGYAGYKEITFRYSPATFFLNAGFETGDLSSWDVETHTWQNATPDSAPFKSEIETAGIDPYAPDIAKVYSGNYSLRVNNDDGSYHISTASQTAIIPNVNKPKLQFYWAAVLEQPNHPPEDQPYVDVNLYDNDTGDYPYDVRFYTGDPNFTGWIDYGNWEAINWQTILIDLDGRQGHSITLSVTAADCNWGAHGGYVYLDAEE